MILGIIGAAIGFKSYIKTKDGRYLWDKFKLKMPVFKALTKKIYIARFSRTLGTLISGGLPILDAIRITSDAVGNVIYKDALDEVAKQVENGVAIATPLRKDPNFPIMVSQMVSVGEQTGKIDDILFRLAKFFENEVDALVKGLSSMIEPIMIVIMGVAVAILVASIIMPIYSLSQVI